MHSGCRPSREDRRSRGHRQAARARTCRIINTYPNSIRLLFRKIPVEVGGEAVSKQQLGWSMRYPTSKVPFSLKLKKNPLVSTRRRWPAQWANPSRLGGRGDGVETFHGRKPFVLSQGGRLSRHHRLAFMHRAPRTPRCMRAVRWWGEGRPCRRRQRVLSTISASMRGYPKATFFRNSNGACMCWHIREWKKNKKSSGVFHLW